MRLALLFVAAFAITVLVLAWLDPCWVSGHRFGTLCETPGNPLGASVR